MYDIVLCVYERFRVDVLKRYVNDDRLRVDGDKNMRLLAFAFTIVFVWTGPQATCYSKFRLQVFHQSHSHIFLRGETTVVLFVLISWIPLTVMLRGKCPSCIKLN